MPDTLAYDLALLNQTRANLVGLLRGHSLAQLNAIPPGLNNNLVWNAAHCHVTLRLLTYGLGGHGHGLDEGYVATYRKGGRPEGSVDEVFVDTLVENLEAAPAELGRDLDALEWGEYRAYTTSYGAAMTTVEQAVRFNSVHEGMHLGTMLAMRRLV